MGLFVFQQSVVQKKIDKGASLFAGCSVRKALSFPLSGHGMKPQLTRKIKEVQAERQPLRQVTLDFGRHREKAHEWVCANDKQYCEWAVLTVVEDGAPASPQSL